MRIPVPTVQRVVDPGIPGGAPLARPAPLTGVQDLAAGFGHVANVLERNQQIAEANLDRVEHEQRKARVMERASSDRLKWTETIQQRMSEAPPGAEGFTPKLTKDFDAYREEALKSVPDEEERRMYGSALLSIRENLAEHGLVFETNQRRAYRKDVLVQGIDTDGRTLTVDPSQFTDVLAQRLAAINSSTDLPADVKAALTDKARDMLSTEAATTMVMRDPSGMLARMQSGDPNADPVLRHLPPQKLQQLIQAAKVEVERSVSGEKTSLAAQERDLQAMVLNGVTPPQVPTIDQYVKAFGPDGARRYESEVATYLRVGNGIKAMRDAPPEQRAALVAAAAPQAGEGFAEQAKVYDAMRQAAAAIDKRLKDDPATYAVENSPRVAQAQRVMAAVMANPDLSLPAGQKSDPAGSRAGVVDFYARTMAAEQARMGVERVRLLTDSQARGIAQQFHEQKQGGKNAADLIAGLEQTWGRWWPQVFDQLATDAKLPGAALVIPNMKDSGARTRLAEWSAMKPADRKALIDPADEKDIRMKVLDQFGAAASSFLAQGGGGQRTIATVIDQAEILAMGYRSQGKSVGDASKQAFDEVMGWKYDFADTYRVPKEQRIGDVQQGAAAFLRTLSDVRVPAMRGIDDAALQQQMTDAVRANPVWVTNRDETGLRLMVKGKDGGLYQVSRADGKPIELQWGELRSAALTERTEEALKGKRLPVPPKKAP